MTRHWTKVFAFTFRHQALSRGYLSATLIVALLLLTLIPGALLLADTLGDSSGRGYGYYPGLLRGGFCGGMPSGGGKHAVCPGDV